VNEEVLQRMAPMEETTTFFQGPLSMTVLEREHRDLRKDFTTAQGVIRDL
jgi:hypothetical protein